MATSVTPMLSTASHLRGSTISWRAHRKGTSNPSIEMDADFKAAELVVLGVQRIVEMRDPLSQFSMRLDAPIFCGIFVAFADDGRGI